MTILRVKDTDTGFWIDATEDDAPELHDAWAAWQRAPERSSQEAHRWNRVLELAQEWFDENGCDGNEPSDVVEVKNA